METFLIILVVIGSLGLGIWGVRGFLIGWLARGGQPGPGGGDGGSDTGSGSDGHSHHHSGGGDSGGGDSGGGDGGGGGD